MTGFGLSLRPRRPVRVERHRTPDWGWRWSCRRCGKADTRIDRWRAALDAAIGHECAFTVTAGAAVAEKTSEPGSAYLSGGYWPDITTKVYL